MKEPSKRTKTNRVAKLKAVTARRQKRKLENSDPRTDIMQVASRLFSRKGFSGTTMAEIADNVGMRGPSLYYYFNDKADILRALADVGLKSALEDSLFHMQEDGLPAPDRLYSLLSKLIVRWRSTPYDLNCMFDPAFLSEEFQDVSEQVQSWILNVETIVKTGIENGDFFQSDEKATTYTIRGILSFAIRDMKGYRHLDPEEMGEFIATFVMRALLSDPSQLGKFESKLGKPEHSK